MVFTLNILCHYLYGEKCHVFTDHKNYHLGKANIAADDLSHKSLFALQSMNTRLSLECDASILAELWVKPLFLHRIRNYRPKIQTSWLSRKWLKMVRFFEPEDPRTPERHENVLRFETKILVAKNETRNF
ncbi:integrase [Gossypium australe]|uniref:Integrase n=1 Tax=Gossypium australe TaxID=47621 RepID=A0A5B6W8N9_9ROSI|nr:integrase [Gossypium australe]